MIDYTVSTSDLSDGSRSFGARLVWDKLEKGEVLTGWLANAFTAINKEAFNQSYVVTKWYYKTYKTRLAVFGVGQLCNEQKALQVLKLLYGFGDGVLNKKGGE